jgi:hypothetical protein
VHDTLSCQAGRLALAWPRSPSPKRKARRIESSLGVRTAMMFVLVKMQLLAFVPRFSTNGLKLVCI